MPAWPVLHSSAWPRDACNDRVDTVLATWPPFQFRGLPSQGSLCVSRGQWPAWVDHWGGATLGAGSTTGLEGWENMTRKKGFPLSGAGTSSFPALGHPDPGLSGF